MENKAVSLTRPSTFIVATSAKAMPSSPSPASTSICATPANCVDAVNSPTRAILNCGACSPPRRCADLSFTNLEGLCN